MNWQQDNINYCHFRNLKHQSHHQTKPVNDSENKHIQSAQIIKSLVATKQQLLPNYYVTYYNLHLLNKKSYLEPYYAP